MMDFRITSKRMNRRISILLIVLLSAAEFHGQGNSQSTYCNPINIDYAYMVYNSSQNNSYRSGADPAVVEFRGEYYMFVTRSMGYWHSNDLTNWHFISPEKWYFQGSNAPTAFNYRDSILYAAGDPSGSMSILYTDNPKKGDWKATPLVLTDLQDPDLFIDDNGQAYMYWGSSNIFPLRVQKLNRQDRFMPDKKVDTLFNLNEAKHGWERFGENNAAADPKGYIEGAWMTKHNKKYYLQYGAPGTEFNVYGDGVYIGDSPTGPFKYAPNNPFSFKPGGFITGMGHGSTVKGPGDQFWHFSTMALGVNIGWERRIGMMATFFDKDGLMFTDNYFGDYPHYAPNAYRKMGGFVGWMLLSYKKPVRASSSLKSFPVENLTDENIKTFWVAQNNDSSQWIEIDLERPAEVHAVQVNFNDYKSTLYGKLDNLRYRYIIESSMDHLNWDTLIDKKDDGKDTPNDYVQLAKSKRARYIRFTNVETPTRNLSISDLRIFGVGAGKKPQTVKFLKVRRQKNEGRNAIISWTKQDNAQGYNVFWGIAPDKLYNTWLVYGDAQLEMRNLNADQKYYFAVEAFNENGVGQRSTTVVVD